MVVVGYDMRQAQIWPTELWRQLDSPARQQQQQLVPITDCSDSKWVAQPSCPEFASVICSSPIVRSHQTNLIWINGHMPSDNFVEQSQSKIPPAVFNVTPAKIMQHLRHTGCPVIPLTNLADRRCNFSNRSQSFTKWGSQMDAVYSSAVIFLHPLTPPNTLPLVGPHPKHQAWTQRRSHRALRQCSFVPVVFL